MADKPLLYVNGNQWEYVDALLVVTASRWPREDVFCLVETVDGFVRISADPDEPRYNVNFRTNAPMQIGIWGKLRAFTAEDAARWEEHLTTLHTEEASA